VPAKTSLPTSPASIASSRPWRPIQILCQPSMQTAVNSTAASNSSCPLPCSAPEISLAKAATSIAPRMPAAMPVATQRPRPLTPSLAASTTPTMSAVASMMPSLFLHHDVALGRRGMEVAEETIAAGIERADINGDLAMAGHDFLAVERMALELLGRGIEVLDQEAHLHSRRDGHLGGLEAMVLDGDRDRRVLGACALGGQRRHQRHREEQHHQTPSHSALTLQLRSVCKYSAPPRRVKARAAATRSRQGRCRRPGGAAPRNTHFP